MSKKPDQDLTQRHNSGKSLYGLKSHNCGPGQCWPLFSTDHSGQPMDTDRRMSRGSLTTSLSSRHGWRVLSPWGAEITWKEWDLQLGHLRKMGRDSNGSSKEMLKHKEVATQISKSSQSLLRLNSQVLRLNQYQWETTFITKYSPNYSSAGEL